MLQAALLRLPAVGDNAAMQTEPPKAEPPKRKRRWFQFSLRTLLIFTVICAIPCAWLAGRLTGNAKNGKQWTRLSNLVAKRITTTRIHRWETAWTRLAAKSARRKLFQRSR